MKGLYAVLGVVIALAVAVGIGCFLIYAKDQTAIVKVFSRQNDAAMKLQAELNASKGKKLEMADIQQALSTYAQSLQNIDYSSCPKNFRLAWFDYTSSVSDFSNKNFEMSAIKDLLELGMSAWTKDGKLTEDALQDTKIPHQIVAHLRRCQRIAISYGVSFHPVSNQR